MFVYEDDVDIVGAKYVLFLAPRIESKYVIYFIFYINFYKGGIRVCRTSYKRQKQSILWRKFFKDFTEDKEILKQVKENNNGYTIAHLQASLGWTTEDKEILKLATDEGRTVAHEQAENGWFTEDKEILKLADKWGMTVALIIAKNGYVFEDKEILMLATIGGWTVAHEQAKNGWITEDKEILKLKCELGPTVAHVQALKTDGLQMTKKF